LDLSMVQSRLHQSTSASMVGAVTDDQRCRTVHRNQTLERLPPPEKFGVREDEPVGLRPQQVDVPPDAGHRTAPAITREQELPRKISHRVVVPPRNRAHRTDAAGTRAHDTPSRTLRLQRQTTSFPSRRPQPYAPGGLPPASDRG